MELKETILRLIATKREGHYWDFKQEFHENNADLLHDIICLSNSLYCGKRFIILGVTDKGEIIGLKPHQEHRKRQSDLLDFLRSKSFAGDIRPEVELKTIILQKEDTFEDVEIDIIIIADKTEKPYWLTKEYSHNKKTVRAYHIYSRNGDTNTPKDQSESIYWVEKMWRQRFGLDNPPMKRMEDYLRKPSDWFKDIDNVSYCYHKDFPEFKIEFSQPEE